jgi:hypothetical protein
MTGSGPMIRRGMMTRAFRLLHLSGPDGPDGLALMGLLLTPVAVGAGALAAWRFGVDAGWTSAFFIAGGFLSHWQVWCAFAVSAEVCAWSLSRGAAKLQPGVPALARTGTPS